MSLPLEGQAAIVTGGSRGIGRAVAERLAAAGAAVTLTARSAGPASEAAAALASATGGTVEGAACDGSDPEACAALVKDVAARRGRLDILVNNAGITRDKLVLRMTDDDWFAVFRASLDAAFFFSRAAARVMMKRQSGRIVNISSIVGLRGNAGQVNYASAKAGLFGLTKSLAREFGSRGITVNAVAPGYVETSMTEALGEEIKVKLLEQIPLGRLGKPEDVAEAVLFLASPAASYITGTILQVDGGLAM